jgi:hypothetical protein
MTINASRLGAVISIVLSAFFLFVSRSYPQGAAFFPRVLLLGIIILSIVLIVRSFQFILYKEPLTLEQKKQVVECATIATIYIFSLPYIGYYVASILFILILTAVLRFQSKIVPVAVAVIFPLIIYVIFEFLLNIPVPSIG